MAGFRSVRIQRFKNLQDTTLDLGDVNVIVGANNSGKSSVLQAIHFSIATIQSLRLLGRLKKAGSTSATINANQLIYVPSDDVETLGAGGKLVQKPKHAIEIDLTLANGDQLEMSV